MGSQVRKRIIEVQNLGVMSGGSLGLGFIADRMVSLQGRLEAAAVKATTTASRSKKQVQGS